MTAPPENIADRPAASADLLEPPEKFADPPAPGDAALGPGAGGPSHDLLSELLRSVRLSGERIVAYAPPRAFSVGFASTGCLHIIEEGEPELRIDGDPHVRHVSRGDFVLLPRNKGAQRLVGKRICGGIGERSPIVSHRRAEFRLGDTD